MEDTGGGWAQVTFPPTEDPAKLSPLVLAYVGDAVYELYVRTTLISDGMGSKPTRQLHREAVGHVRAQAQAQALHRIRPTLSPDEEEIVRRGRNVKSKATPRSVDVLEYRHSTAFEALLGYLYLSGRSERLAAILAQAVRSSDL